MKINAMWLCVVLLASVVSGSAVGPASREEKSMKPALLVIDIQNEYLAMIPEQERNLGLRMINYAIRLFRESGFPVIRIYHSDIEDGTKPGTEAFEFPASIAIKAEDPKIIKNYPNAFKRTDLDRWLRREGCDTLFLCGLSAAYCVLATYHGAADLDYRVFMIKDAVMSHDSRFTEVVEDIVGAVGFRALALILEQAKMRQ